MRTYLQLNKTPLQFRKLLHYHQKDFIGETSSRLPPEQSDGAWSAKSIREPFCHH